ncbi:MAG TPA: class I SAM-dependent methyltransferase [Hyphomicrobiales bacterium]|nr:class I SAM-dependent methyltransferase [Hyphomicrobiales bacterium]
MTSLSGQAEFWDERYRGDSYAFGKTPNAFLVSQSHYLSPGLRALVPGDGEGRNGVWLAGQGLTVDTVDVSPLGVEKARKLAAERGVIIGTEIADLLSWDWPRNRYDLVAALYVHFFDTDRPRMHRAMIEALKPGGILIFEAFSLAQAEMKKKYHSGGPPNTDMLYSNEKLSADFKDAEMLLLEETIVELDEGHRHKGPAAVIRAIVRKPA